ncbi:hypothetical protein [Ammoniphilus sp. 3BR4]|uniref:hypothetical protein n=1 Tax=Ammoniphilus sp. 3BR4 TaxID=3158265 RepID=UPI003466B3DF
MRFKPISFVRIIFISLLIGLLGCQKDTEHTEIEEPFIFSFNRNTIERKNAEDVNIWLKKAKSEHQSKLHSYDMGNGYMYFYAKGFSDVAVTYSMEAKNDNRARLIKARFNKGNEHDEVFIEVKYNPLLCCDGMAVE